MVEKITNNLGWKLLSILLAFLLWIIVVNYEDPYTTITVSDIPVEKKNVEAIESERKAIEYKEGETVTVRLRGKRSILDRMDAGDIYAFADLEKKSITGAIDIQIDVADGVTILDKQPSMMMVDLENIITVQKEIQYYMEGEPREGYIYLDPIITPNNIEIEGPESKIAQIKSVLVPVNIENAIRDVSLYRTPNIMDESNNEITGLSKSLNQVQIQVPVQQLKQINLLQNLGSDVAEGYELVDVTLSQDTIQVRGEEETLDGVNNISISNEDISGLTENTTLSVNVASLLPSGVYIYDDVSTIEVYVEIEPIVEKTIEVTPSDITVRGLPEDMQFSYVNENSYMLTFRGIRSKLDDIDLDGIAPSITLTDLEEGVHDVPLSYYIPFDVNLVNESPIVRVELTTIEPGTTGNNTDDDDQDQQETGN